MTTTYGLTSAGYVAPRQADFIARIRSQYETDTGLSFNWNRDEFLSWLTENMAKQLDLIGEASQAVYDARALSNATGINLDHLCLIVGVQRNEATSSTATVTLTGTPGLIITQGKLVEGGGLEDRDRWVLTANATVGGGGTVDATVEAVDPGATLADPGAIDRIVTPVSGWASVTNAAEAVPGQARETDGELRARRQRSLARGGSSSVAAIRTALLELDYMEAAVVVENDTGATAIVGGLTLTAHSVGIILHPSTITTTQQEEVAELVYGLLSAGIATNGTDVVATIQGGDGYEKEIRWDWATTVTINSAITVSLESGFDLDDVQQPLIDAVADYFLTLAPGDTVRLLELYSLAATILGVVGAAPLLNGGAADVSVAFNQVPILGTNTVTE